MAQEAQIGVTQKRPKGQSLLQETCRGKEGQVQSPSPKEGSVKDSCHFWWSTWEAAAFSPWNLCPWQTPAGRLEPRQHLLPLSPTKWLIPNPFSCPTYLSFLSGSRWWTQSREEDDNWPGWGAGGCLVTLVPHLKLSGRRGGTWNKTGIQQNVTFHQHTNSTELWGFLHILNKPLKTDQFAPGNNLRGWLPIWRSQNLGSESLSTLQKEPSTFLTSSEQAEALPWSQTLIISFASFPPSAKNSAAVEEKGTSETEGN